MTGACLSMKYLHLLTCAAATALLAATPTMAAATDLTAVNRIMDMGLNHSQVVATEAYLADQIGGRMTNSPAMRKAEAWTSDQFRAWGLSQVRKEGFAFGRGWWIDAAHVRMTSPRPVELASIPVAWTPATAGPLTASVIVAPMRSERDFAQWKGKLAGKIVLVSWPAPPKDDTTAPFARLTDADIAKLDHIQLPHLDPKRDADLVKYFTFGARLDAFLASEGAVAWARMSRTEGRRVHGEGYSYQAGATPKLPGVELGAEDYRRLARLARIGDVKLEIDSRVRFDDTDLNAYNVLADIPGKDAKAGYVMAGAHLDSWVAGDGASDNGAGSAVVMEAARILAALGVKPRRSIRFVLWAGEEQGLLGSAAYVEQHVATRPKPADPEIAKLGPYFGGNQFPVTFKPEAAQLAAYFNIDNGSGKVRGVYAEGNVAAAPILREWLAPLSGLAAGAVVTSPTGSTDHVFFNDLGLPAFQFIQDPLDYESRVHHTDIDTFDHARPDDLRQAAVVLATLLLDAADAEAPMPRKPPPTKPQPDDPTATPEPDWR